MKDRVKDFRRVRASELQPHALNFRSHPKEQSAALRTMLDRIGFAGAVLAYEDDGALQIIDGHLRVQESKPSDELPTVILDVTPEEAEELLATFDPIGSMAGRNEDALSELIARLDPDEALAKVLESVGHLSNGKGGLTDPDEVPEVPEEPVTKPGDLWVLGEHRVMCGDATEQTDVERLMGGGMAAAVVTDPPYGIEREGVTNDDPQGLDALLRGAVAQLPIQDAVVVAFASPRLFPVWLDAIREGGHHFERMLWMYKPNDETFPWRGWLLKSEAILVSTVGRGSWNEVHPFAHDCYEANWGHETKTDVPGWHGSIKPFTVIQDLVQRVSEPGQTIVDPFLGSGTTLLAAEGLGRICYGCEIEPGYVDVAVRRWENHTGKQAELA